MRAYYPRSTVVDLVGEHPQELAGGKWQKPQIQALARNYRRTRNGTQQWVTLDFADKLLTVCGRNLWELGEPTTFSRYPHLGSEQTSGD